MNKMEFIELLHLLIKDEFIAQSQIVNNQITVKFLDGSTFNINVS